MGMIRSDGWNAAAPKQKGATSPLLLLTTENTRSSVAFTSKFR
jgi:hypothetical protein